MARVVWSRRGLNNFSEQLSFIEKDSSQNARQIAGKIIEKIDLLRNYPEMGRIVPEFNQKDIRESFLNVSSGALLYCTVGFCCQKQYERMAFGGCFLFG